MNRAIAIGLSIFIPLVSHAADPVEIDYDPPQRLDARFRLFKTINTWNLLELDTQTGKVWQVQFSVSDDASRFKIPINPEPLVKDGRPGRFTIYQTRNKWNVILLDQDTGKTWQVQYSTDSSQFFKLIEESKPKAVAEPVWKQ